MRGIKVLSFVFYQSGMKPISNYLWVPAVNLTTRIKDKMPKLKDLDNIEINYK